MNLEEVREGDIVLAETGFIDNKPVVIVSMVTRTSLVPFWSVARIWDIYKGGIYPDKNIPTRLGVYHWALPYEMKRIKLNAYGKFLLKTMRNRQ